MEISISEPHFYLTHGGNSSKDKYMVVYSYTLDEFYNLEWRDEFKFYHNSLVHKLNENHDIQHDIIRNYREGIKKKKMFQINLVKIFEDDNRVQTCILYTYRLNIFKRIWKRKYLERIPIII
jgi:hypothetical protein